MLITNISAESLTKSQIIALGRQLETNYRQIVFDCSGFTEPIDTIMLVHQRNGDVAPYVVNTTTGTELTWTVTDTDTSFYGYGHGELRIYFANGLAKSVVFPTLVIKSITADAVIPAQLQSWYDAMIDYIDNHTVTIEEVDAVVEQYLIDHPVQAPVQSVNGYTGAVVLTAADVGALASNTAFVASFNGQTGAVTYTPPVSSVNGKTGGVTLKTSDLQNDSGYITSAPVASVDGKTGTVAVLPTGGTTGQVLAKKTGTNYDVEWQTVSGGGAVDSVNGQTGTVVLDASDVGALPDTYVAPVTSVNTKTGAVTLTASDVGALSSSTTFVSSFNGSTGAVTYSAPVTSVNGSTGAVVIGNATTASAGLMSATDKSHLDDVYADYSSALTALGVS